MNYCTIQIFAKMQHCAKKEGGSKSLMKMFMKYAKKQENSEKIGKIKENSAKHF